MMRALLLSAILLSATSMAHAQAPPPVEAFGRLPAISDAAISPDGAHVAMAMSQSDGGSFITVINLAQRRAIFTAAVQEETQLRGVGWADDQHVSFVISQTFHPGQVLPGYVRFRGSPRRVDYYRTGVVELATREMEILTINEEEQWQDQGARLIAPIEGDPGFARMIGRAPGVETIRPAVYRVNLNSGTSRMVTTRGANSDTLYYVLNPRGEVALRMDSDEATNRWRLFLYDGEEPRLLMEDISETGEPIEVEGFLPDGRLVVLDQDEAGEFSRLYAVDRVSGERSVLFERAGFELNGAIHDPWTRQVVGVSWTEVEPVQHFFDPALQSAHEAATATFRGNSFVFTSWSRDLTKFVVWAEFGLDGGGYYLYSRADNSIRPISMAYPELSESPHGERQSIIYRARDGTRIPAYLTLPSAEGRNLPLVLLVHGGPYWRDTMAFDWWASFLVSRGYAVLQPNFRGSSGYGASWERAGHGQWGGLMQTDVEDGVAALVRSGIADPNRVCIVGASYGGYAALAGATLTPDRYKCAASIAGVSDLNAMLRQDQAETGARSISSDYWRISIGDRQEDRERIRSVSPANLADRVQIPILLIHGTDDTVVPITQSRLMRDRLQAAGKQVRYVELRGDDHWLSDAPTRIQMLRELDSFLAQHLGPASQ